jgi:hypothetical protein
LFVYSIIWFIIKNIWGFHPIFLKILTREARQFNERNEVEMKERAELSLFMIARFADVC